MRISLSLPLALVVALLACGCGEDAPGASAFTFVSKAHAGEGDAIRLVFAPAEGEVYEMRMAMTGAVTAKGEGVDQTTPLDMTMTITYRCDRVRPDGGRVVSATIGAFGGSTLEAPGAAAALSGLRDVRTVMHMDRHGGIERVEMSGGDAEMRRKVEEMFSQPGGKPFLVYPADGLRVGEAIDYAELFDSDQARKMLGAAAPGLETEVKGEAVLMRRLELEGRDAVEFHINLVMNLRGEVSEAGKSIRMDMGLKVTGTQFVEVATGMPMGRLPLRMEARGTARHGDESMEITSNLAMDAEITRTAASEPMTPEAPVRDR